MLAIAACINGETESFGMYYKEALGSLLRICINGETVIYGIYHEEARGLQ